MTDTGEIAAAKKRARLAAKKQRADAYDLQGDQAARQLAVNGLPFAMPYPGAVISGYYPSQSEIDVLPLLVSLVMSGWTTCLPVVTGTGQPLIFRQWQPGEKTDIGVWDIPVPDAGARVVRPDCLLVPLLAFDRAGFRLGYGGGFYDRTIAALAKSNSRLITAGVAFLAQEMPQVPRGRHDQPLDWIISEQGAIRCG